MAICRLGQKETNYDHHTGDNKNDKSQVSLKTWQDLFDYMDIEPVKLPWNADGVTALRILRENYGAQTREINDKYLDEVMSNFANCGSEKQLAALGSAMTELGMNLCEINLNTHEFIVFIRKTDKIEAWNDRWCKSVKCRRYGLIRTFALSRGESINTPVEDIRIPMSSIQVAETSLFDRDRYNELIIDHFLIISQSICELDCEQEVMRVYDLRYWPMREIEKVHYTYNQNNIEPYTLEIETECGEHYCYVGNGRDWYKTTENAKGDSIPVYDDERSDDAWHGLSLGGKQPQTIPEIRDARPLLTIDNCIIYRYIKPDIDHREPDEDNWTPTMRYLNYHEMRKNRNALIEYNTVTKQYRKLSLPGAYSLSDRNITIYKNTWLVLNENLRRSQSYLLRFWNPRTNECLRLTEQDMGKHQINRIIPTPNGEILFLLDDGRLCHPDVDLVAWLKQDLQLHEIPLEDWQNETRRSYENFPEEEHRFSRLRDCMATDHMLITFKDGKTYDILIKDNEI